TSFILNLKFYLAKVGENLQTLAATFSVSCCLSGYNDASLDSTAQTGNQIDWQEEGYQKIKAMKEMYYAELNEIFQKISFKLQQNDSLPQQPKPEQLQKLRDFKQMLESLLQFLQLT
ncbi:Mediator of RNA polymerase II transcription subunit 15a-like protein, partial [Drosera capensis]